MGGPRRSLLFCEPKTGWRLESPTLFSHATPHQRRPQPAPNNMATNNIAKHLCCAQVAHLGTGRSEGVQGGSNFQKWGIQYWSHVCTLCPALWSSGGLDAGKINQGTISCILGHPKQLAPPSGSGNKRPQVLSNACHPRA